jgi:phage terminase small subunit
MSVKRRGRPVTDAQVRFCEEYMKDLNATRAYSMAYPGAKSEKIAASAASRLLRNVKVQGYLEHLLDKRSRKTEIRAEKVLAEMARLAFSNILDFVEFDEYTFRAHLKHSADLDPDAAAAIQSVTSGPNGTTIKLHSKVPALVKLMQHTGLLPKGDTLRLINDRGEPMIPAAAIQHAIQSGLAQGPEWMEGLVSKAEMRLLFPERFRALGENQ